MNTHTKQQQDKVFEIDFIDSQKSNPPICVPFGIKSIYIWLVPKGVQEKRTEVLENKVDKMWVSNAFF